MPCDSLNGELRRAGAPAPWWSGKVLRGHLGSPGGSKVGTASMVDPQFHLLLIHTSKHSLFVVDA